MIAYLGLIYVTQIGSIKAIALFFKTGNPQTKNEKESKKNCMKYMRNKYMYLYMYMKPYKLNLILKNSFTFSRKKLEQNS